MCSRISSPTYVLRLHLLPSPSRLPTDIFATTQLPFWLLVSFGAYLLARLGWGVLTFNDVPEAHKEIVAEIEMAKKDLRRLGVDVD